MGRAVLESAALETPADDPFCVTYSSQLKLSECNLNRRTRDKGVAKIIGASVDLSKKHKMDCRPVFPMLPILRLPSPQRLIGKSTQMDMLQSRHVDRPTFLVGLPPGPAELMTLRGSIVSTYSIQIPPEADYNKVHFSLTKSHFPADSIILIFRLGFGYFALHYQGLITHTIGLRP